MLYEEGKLIWYWMEGVLSFNSHFLVTRAKFMVGKVNVFNLPQPFCTYFFMFCKCSKRAHFLEKSIDSVIGCVSTSAFF